ncbi:hypothetical protein J2T12_003693 [Paenibacillus anaericanus]|nr:hypothetical protein [Paenibacillus anaericanus]
MGTYFISSIAFKTLFLISAVVFALFVNTLETVAGETPAARATSLIVAI